MFAGYLANWKMFEPRKLIPFSIEFWRAPIAVITEITEKTPIVIPIMVKPERNLFTPNEPKAMVMISLNFMTLTRIFHHRDHGDHRVTKKFPQAVRVPSAALLVLTRAH